VSLTESAWVKHPDDSRFLYPLRPDRMLHPYTGASFFGSHAWRAIIRFFRFFEKIFVFSFFETKTKVQVSRESSACNVVHLFYIVKGNCVFGRRAARFFPLTLGGVGIQ
jgi:hypothetical protein